MVAKDALVCLGTVVFLGAFSYYSFLGYQSAEKATLYEGDKAHEARVRARSVLNRSRIEALTKDVAKESFSTAQKRDPFARRLKKVPSVKPQPVKFELPKPKIEPVKVEPVPEPKRIENYFFRGKVILGDQASFAIEREGDGKTFFVNKGDQTRDFLVIETSEKQVVITDFDGNVRLLKKS
jgi:hypothetical protein